MHHTTRIKPMNSETKTCQNCKSEFTIEPDDFSFYEKIKVQPPTWCPECRYIRRLLDRNEYNFCKRKCDATGKSIISIYRSDAPFPVYNQEYWKSDAWDPTQYGRDFDFSRPFFEQYEELRRAVPHLAMVNSNSVNSEYTNQAQNNKDCYMLVTSDRCEKCMYGSWCEKSFLCSDCYMTEKSEFCYECINVAKCSGCAWCYDCSDCIGVYLSSNCRGCSNCFGCVGLRNKQYHWFNENLGKEEYEKRLQTSHLNRGFLQEAREKFSRLRLSIPVKFYHGMQTQSSSGDYIENTQRARSAFNCRDNKDTAYMQDAWQQNEDCRDCTEIIVGQLSYETQGVDSPHRTIVARSCFNTITDSCYCDMCFGTSNCFGCFGLKKGSYCILNKQYSKEEYVELKKKIIEHMEKTGEWGQYFPPEVSPFTYNESMAQDYFPLSKAEALAKGYSWRDREKQEYQVTIPASKLSETIAETNDSILNETIGCISQESPGEKENRPLCVGAFRIVPLELEIYRKLQIPLPQKCFPCRRTDRFTLRNPRRLWKRGCQCRGKADDSQLTTDDKGASRYANTTAHFHGGEPCPNEFETSYAPDRPEIVYCESCYNSEIA